MTQILGRVFLGLVAIVTVGYAGFQVWRLAGAEYDTVPAVEYIISDKITAKGVAIREEKILSGHGSENLSYLYMDGTHVSKGMPVAQVVKSKEDITRQMKRDALQRELSNLMSLSVAADTLILQTDTVSQRVYANIDIIAAQAAAGRLDQVGDVKYDILTQLNRRSLATQQETSFDARVQMLENKINALGGTAVSTQQITAPQPGYFTKNVDGMEGMITPQNMDSLGVDEFVEFINTPTVPIEDSVGKLITSYVWYFAVVVPSAETDKFRQGSKVELDFGLTDTRPFIARIHKVLREDNGARTVVVFRCDEMSEELSNIRTHKVEISLNEMSGFKLPKACKHYLNNQLGVYVLETTVITFKPVEVIYESEKEDYVVFSQNYRDEEGKGLKRFDEVIVGGSGLKDGKVIKQ